MKILLQSAQNEFSGSGDGFPAGIVACFGNDSVYTPKECQIENFRLAP